MAAQVYDIDRDSGFTAAAGAAFSEGDFLCVKTDGLLYKADSDASGTRLCVGVASQACVSADVTAAKKFTAFRRCKIKQSTATYTAFERQWLYNTAGAIVNAIMTTNANQYLLVGLALSTTVLQVEFSLSDLGLGAQSTGNSTLIQV